MNYLSFMELLYHGVTFNKVLYLYMEQKPKHKMLAAISDIK